ncbi:hypothetical protein KAK07_01460 [Ideonella sp. 4Y16]|uniref:hypothetical protein n=1 Tax=Ideonella alba TaxID=2824118 RepID=UPI001B366AE1|nr:hypothetical protein [Ideonella alba]MBQ0941993.1 hypothetical protein [Ideonella alba]
MHGVDWSSAPDQSDAETARLNRYAAAGSGSGEPSRDWFAGSSLRLGESGRGPRLGTGSIEPDPTPDELQAAFRQSERDYRSRTERSVAGSGYVARNGDSISRIVGSSDPQAIGNFMRANGLSSSNVEAGRNYFRPDEVTAYGDSAALGQAVLNNDNARLAALAQERFAFSDGRDARDIRESFAYQSRMSRELGDLQAQAAYQAKLANGPSVSAWDGVKRDAPGAVSPAYKAVTSALGMVADGLGTVQGVAITLTGAALTAAPEPTTLTKWAGVPLAAYGATFTAKSVAGFGLNATNLVTALRGSTLEADYLPGSALEMAVSLRGGSPEAQRLAVAGDLAWGLATGRVLNAQLATGSNPRVASLFQEVPYAYTSAERQAALLAPNTWNIVTRLERPAGYPDLGVKVWENIVLPSMPPEEKK